MGVFITMDVKLKGWSSATIKVVGESPILRLRPCIALRQFCEGFRREREVFLPQKKPRRVHAEA